MLEQLETKQLALLHLRQFWSTAPAIKSVNADPILIDLVHVHPEYLYRSLVLAKFAQVITGGRLIGLIGRPNILTMRLGMDLDFIRELASGFGVDEFIEMPEEINDFDAIPPVPDQLSEIIDHECEGTPLAPDTVERLHTIADPQDEFQIGRALHDTFVRNEQDPMLRHGKRLRLWCVNMLKLREWALQMNTGPDRPGIFVTNHLDYFWGLIGWHVVKAGGRVIHYRLDHRLPVSFIDTLQEGGTLNGSMRRGNGRGFERLERSLSGNPVTSALAFEIADKLHEAVTKGLSQHFRGKIGTGLDRAEFDRSKPNYIAFAHTFWDQPVADSGLFRGHLDWLCATLEQAERSGEFNILVKAHPGDNGQRPSSAINYLEHRFADFENIKFTRHSISTQSILQQYDAGITVRGSPGVEMTSAGLPMIVVGDGPYSDCGFCFRPETREIYFAALAAGLPGAFDIKHQSARARLYNAFDRFWSALASPLIRPYYPKLADQAWWQRIDDAVIGADLMTDPILGAMRENWHGRNVRVVPILMDAAFGSPGSKEAQ